MLPHFSLTSRILGATFRVHNTLGPGYLEHVYQNALALLLRREELRIRLESRLPVMFEGIEVGYCESDLIVEEIIVVETKAMASILPGHEMRLRAYLKCSGFETGLLLNFGPTRVDVRRLTQTREERKSG